jgi:acyl-[acyl carrier protein]--UDP-N-acetylglucosamine O-acyltransferase
LEKMKEEIKDSTEVDTLVEFIQSSSRGVIK